MYTLDTIGGATHSSILAWEISWTVEPGGLQSESASEVAQLCVTICDPMDCSLPGSSIHGIFQAKVLEWVAISLSRGSSWSRGRIRSPALQADALASEPLGKQGYSLWGCKELHTTEQLTHTWMLFTTEIKLEQEKEEARIPIFKSQVKLTAIGLYPSGNFSSSCSHHWGCPPPLSPDFDCSSWWSERCCWQWTPSLNSLSHSVPLVVRNYLVHYNRLQTTEKYIEDLLSQLHILHLNNLLG